MSTYSAKIGADNIAFLIDGPLRDLADHVLSEEDTIAGGWDAATLVFDEAVLQFLRRLPDDRDGCVNEHREMFFEGDAYPIEHVGEGVPATDDRMADQIDAWEAHRDAYDTEGDERLDVAVEGP